MDDVTLESLEGALSQSPGNDKLLSVVVRELLSRGQGKQALEHVRRCPSLAQASVEARAIAARALLAGGFADEAAALCQGDAAELLLVRADALARLERHEEALALYQD